MLDPGRTATTTSQNHNHHQISIPSDQNQIIQPVPGRLSCDSYVTYDIRDYGNRVRNSAEYYAKFRQSWSGPLVSAADDEEDEFGFSTPPMWSPTRPSASPLPQPPHRKDINNHYRNLSPASKTKAIARGQRELMEIVSKMPESCYELSLKDLVEKQQPIVEENKEEQEQVQVQGEKGVKKKKNDKKMETVKKKNGSVRINKNNEGLLLKMVFPVAFGMKNKKKSELGSYSFKVAPRHPVMEGSDKSVVDKEWWKKRFEQSESESSGSSSNNGSAKSSVSSNSSSTLSRNSSRHESGGCWPFPFIRNKKTKTLQ